MKKREAENLSRKIVKILIEQRKIKDISRYRISKLTGLSESSLLYIEKKSQQPSLPTLLMIAESIGVDLGAVIQQITKK